MTNIEQYINNSSCTILPKRVSKYLQEDNFLSEFGTDEEKELAMLNLLLLDNVPTEGSTKLINSGDIYNALKDLSNLSKKIYLKPNIVEDRNILTQLMVNNPNSIYVIQENFDLNNQEISIKEGCVLLFEGGSLNNGTLNLSKNSSILSYDTKIFDNVTIVGGYGIDWNIIWFGAKSANHISQVKDNNNQNKDYLIEDYNTEISHIILDMINKGCRSIYIPIGIYYWNTKVVSQSNLKLYGNFIRAHTWDASTDSYNFSNTGIHILRNVEAALLIGGEKISETSLRRSTLEMYGLLFKGVYGSDTTLITGCLQTSHIHDNYVRYIGYFINSLAKSWRGQTFCEKFGINYDPEVDKPRSGLWVVSRIYNNRVSNITHACFKCHISDSTIMYNYFSGALCKTIIDSNGNVLHIPNKSVFYDGSNWDGFSASLVSSNYIDYFYIIYLSAPSSGDYPTSIYSINNVYDICSTVFQSYARTLNPNNSNDPYDDSVYQKYSTAQSFVSIGDEYVRINNKEYLIKVNGEIFAEADWTFDDTNVPLDQSTRMHFGLIRGNTLPGIGVVDDIPTKDGESDYYMLDGCYSVFKSIPRYLYMIGCNFKYVDYIFLGKEISLGIGTYHAKDINILCGTSEMFHFSRFTNDADVRINIPLKISTSDDFVEFPNEINVTNPEINNYIENTTLSLTTENIENYSTVSIRNNNTLLRDIYSIPLCNNFNNFLINPVISRCYIINLDNTLSYVIDTKGDNLIYNLIPNKKYAYILIYSNLDGQINRYDKYYFNTTGKVRLITLEGCSNVRDIGGWECLDNSGNVIGTVKYNKIIRGGSLKNISYKGKLQLLNDLYVTSEINLSLEETQNISELNYSTYTITQYNLEDNKDIIGNIINDINLQSGCVYIHDLSGRDKVGTFIMILLGLLGVSIDNILKDFAISGLYTTSSELLYALNFMKSICDLYSNGQYTDIGYTNGVKNYLAECNVSEEQINNLITNLIDNVQ